MAKPRARRAKKGQSVPPPEVAAAAEVEAPAAADQVQDEFAFTPEPAAAPEPIAAEVEALSAPDACYEPSYEHELTGPIPVAAPAGEQRPEIVAEARHADEILPPPPDPSDRDEISVPPAGDLDARFFAAETHSEAPPAPEAEERDPRVAQKMSAGAMRRRAQLSKYVKVAVGFSAALCVAALVKVGVARNHSAAAEPVHAAAPAQIEAAPAADPVDPAALEQPAAPAQATAAAPAEVVDPALQAALHPDPADVTVTAARDDSLPNDPKAAVREKNTARALLERTRISDSIAAGELSVALDPTDGEAWLILGAAYQQKGDVKEARRCFKACVDEGKRGPRKECAALLR